MAIKLIFNGLANIHKLTNFPPLKLYNTYSMIKQK